MPSEPGSDLIFRAVIEFAAPPSHPAGTSVSTPVVEHNHPEFRSITGGDVYHGKKHPALKGASIYGNYDTSRVWLPRYDEVDIKLTHESST